MTFKLFIQALIKFLLGIALVGVLIFWPAGTFAYLNGWTLMGILFIPMLAVGIILIIKDPALLEKRLISKEDDKKQDIVVKLSGLMFISGFIVAGLGRRFDWYILPLPAVIAAAVIFLLSYVLYALVMKENKYLSRTIEIQEGQRVVDTGPYSIVRHPMYSATLLLFLSMPIVLGSVYSLFIFLAYPVIIAFRIINEEKLLEKELPGYIEYKKKVKYRLIPFVW